MRLIRARGAPRCALGPGRGGRALGLVAALLASGSLGCAATRVVRVVEGHEVEGRFISEEAYAYYARAAQEEATGGFPERVLVALQGAAREDPSSVEVWTKLGAAWCRVRDAAKSEEAFARAEAQDASFSPIYRERARCALIEASAWPSFEGKRGMWQRALRFAEQAVFLDPEDLAATVLTADLLARLGQEAEGGRLLAAFSIRQPTSTEALRALRDFARAHKDEALALRAERRLGALPFQLPEGPGDGSSKGASSLAAVDAALGEGDLAEALRLAHRAHLPASEVAVRAAALGRVPAARAEALRVLGADPGDGSAQVALAVALDLAGEEAAVSEALARAATAGSFTPPSPLARLLFAELLERRVSAEAARLFLGSAPLDGSAASGGAASPGGASPAAGSGRGRKPGAEDALLSRVSARLAARLGSAR